MFNGFVNQFYKFKKVILEKFPDYDMQILEEEFNTAIHQRTLQDWKQIENDKEFLQLLQYQSTGDYLVCPICEKLDNIIRQVDINLSRIIMNIKLLIGMRGKR